MRLQNQVALVTGASSGIGKAIALRLAEEGANLCLLGRRVETLDALAEKARKTSARVLTYRVDLEADRDIYDLPSRLGQDFPRLDIVVHSAGIIYLGRIHETPHENFDRQYATNVRAPSLLTQVLLPMLTLSKGQVVFVNSSAGLHARAGVCHYAATKHALKALADSLREELNPAGVRVLSLFIGRTATPMQASVHDKEKKPYHPEDLMQPEDVAEMVLAALTIARTAEVTEISMRPLKGPNPASLVVGKPCS